MRMSALTRRSRQKAVGHGDREVARPRAICLRATLEDLDRWIEAAFEAGFVCFDTETDSLDPMQANLVGVSLALRPIAPAIFP